MEKQKDVVQAFKLRLQELGFKNINVSDYVKEKEIGKGGYGKVYKGTFEGKTVAIKELFIECKDKQAFDEILKEITFIETAKNEKLPHFYGVSISEDSMISLVFEFINGKSLNDIYKEMNDKDKLDVIRQLTEILVFLHERKLIHRDIKPQNIMVEENNNVRLIDFGVSKVAEHTSTKTANQMGTTCYMAPENFDVDVENPDNTRPIAITPKADVWSVGCMISELFSGVQPWGKLNQINIERKLTIKAPFPIPKDIKNDMVISLITGCTNVEPTERFSSKELLEKITEGIKVI